MLTQSQPKMYVLVRRDLDETYRCVQGGHALAEYALRGDLDAFRTWNNSTLVYLGVTNEFMLKMWAEKLTKKGKRWVGFREPDLTNQLTAIACIDNGEIFKKLPLA
jgi:hypothetical protein